jgi:capsular polysaccharide export protein
MHGDRRPYHIIAAEEARARGIAVVATDLGYIRPDWITLEYDGMTTYSRFPRDAAAIHALAARFPAPDLAPRFRTPFWLIAMLDVFYNLGLVFGRPLYPHYRYHSTCHPFAEYAGWLWSRPRTAITGRRTAMSKHRLSQARGSYFIVPLQISTDFQIRAHSRFLDVREAAREIVASFAASGSPRKLAFVVHPLDNGLIAWHRFVGRLAAEYGVAAQVQVIDGGTPIDLLRNAAGVVTVNSTVGLTALHHGVPLKVLGNAVFDVPGLACQAPLDDFWNAPVPPDRALMTAFLRALAGTTQVKGGYYQRASQDHAINGFVERLEPGLYPLPPLTPEQFAARTPRGIVRTVVITGATGPLGTALARAYAAPGAHLRLIGGLADRLERLAEDCRQRGALVETICLAGKAHASLADVRAAAQGGCTSPDVLVACAGDDLPAGLDWVAAFAERMKDRGGEIALVGDFASRGNAASPWSTREALLTCGAALRRRFGSHGVALTVVAPSGIARRIARWGGASLATDGDADRFAAAIIRGMKRGQAVVELPAVATAAARALRLVARRLRLPEIAAIHERVEKTPLPGESGPGD